MKINDKHLQTSLVESSCYSFVLRIGTTMAFADRYFSTFSSFLVFVYLFILADFGVLCSERAHANSEFYTNKLILAPMVRMNKLPFRLLALEYGADIVYSEEIVDHKILRSTRRYNEILNTIDFVDRVDGSVIFRTCPQEKNKIVFQMGTSDPERAAKAASLVAKDVAGIDINMGCPRHFSLAGGMGAALLCHPDMAGKIIESVRNAVDIPVTCKIRLHPNIEDTISFCKVMIESGITAIAVHGRTETQKPHYPNQITAIRNISSSFSIPIIANGESGNIKTFDDILAFKRNSGCASVMIARAAQDNPSIFRPDGKLPTDEVIRAYLKHAIRYSNWFPDTKWCIQCMLGPELDTPRGSSFQEAKDLVEICKLWNMEEYCLETMKKYPIEGFQKPAEESPKAEKPKTKPSGCHSLRYKFERSNFVNDADLPKSLLQRYAQKSLSTEPKYETWCRDNFYQSIVTFNGSRYTSTYWERNKKYAEQGAAAVCLTHLKQKLPIAHRTKEIVQ